MSSSLFPTVALKRIASIYNGNSIKDEDKDMFSDPSNAVPYIATKDISAKYEIDYSNGMYVKIDDTDFKRAIPGSTLICLEGGSAGKKIAQTNQEVAFVNKLCCINATTVNQDYLYYALQSTPFKDCFNSNLTGLIGGVSMRDLGNIKIPVPDKNTQTAIACYLNNKIDMIDKQVSTIEKSLALLNELRLLVISKTVTRGLNPNTTYEDSNVNWIGSIPSNWKKSRIGWIVKRPISYGIIKLGDIPDSNGVPVLRCSDVKHGTLNFDNVRQVASELSLEFARTILNGGEVLINVRGTLGGCAIAPEKCRGWNIAREVAMIDVASNHEARFVKYFLMSSNFWNYLNSNLAGSVYQGLNIELLERATIVLPELEEQVAIANYLDTFSSKIDALMLAKNRYIDALQEYRQSLISEAVTGKFKAPGVE